MFKNITNIAGIIANYWDALAALNWILMMLLVKFKKKAYNLECF